MVCGENWRPSGLTAIANVVQHVPGICYEETQIPRSCIPNARVAINGY